MIKPVNYEPSQHFGENPTSILPANHWLIQQFGNYQPDGHTGIDYPCPSGTPVKAVTAGTVLHVGWFGGSYADNPYWIAPGFAGFCYVVDHGDFVGIYAHCLEGGARVNVGQRVAEGQVLGLSGNTGGSTGDHLHFEVLPNGWITNSRMYGRINPATILARITPQSTTPAKPKEPFTMAQYDDIMDKLTAIGKDARNTWSGVWVGGTNVDGKKFDYGILPIVAESQRRDAIAQAQIKGLVGAIAALAKGESLDEAKLLAGVQAAAEAGVKAGLENGAVTVDINVAGGK